jgi:hypothetical protein
LKHDLGAEDVVQRRGETLFLCTHGWPIALEQIDGEFAQGIEVGRGVTATDTTIVVAESDIKHPVQLVFNAPMGANGVGKRLGLPERVVI